MLFRHWSLALRLCRKALWGLLRTRSDKSFSLSCPRQERGQGSDPAGCGISGFAARRWQLRIKVSPLRHMETMCTHFCFCGHALGSCLAAAERAGSLNSHISELAVLPWALGVPGQPSSPRSLQSCLWSLLPVEPASLWVSNNWQTRVAVPSSVGLCTRLDIYSGFSYFSFPCFPKEEAHTKESRFCYLGLPLFMYLQGKQRKCLLTLGKTNYFKMKGENC